MVLSPLHSGKEPPGPAGRLGLAEMRQDPLQFIMDLTRAYGDIVRYRVDQWVVTLVNRPDYVEHILHERPRQYVKTGTPDFMMLRPMLGDGLLTSDNESWLYQRRLTQPAFHRQRLELFGAPMVQAANAMLDEWDAYAASGQPIEVGQAMTQLTLRIAARMLFGYAMGPTAGAFGAAVEVLNESMGHSDPSAVDGARLAQALAVIQRIVEQIIRQRQAAPGLEDDCLTLLLDAHDETTGQGLSARQLRDEVITLLLAGHETTAKAMSWALYLLAEHPSAAQRVQAEVATVLAGRLPGVADLPRLTFTRWVIEETLRLYPPIWVMSRMCTADDEIDGFTVPAGSLVTISPYALHRTAYWTAPERFDPDRFAPELAAQRPEFAYLPFGGGPRLCLGKHFALLETHLVLAAIAQRFRLHSRPGHPVVPEALVTLRAKYGLPMTLERLTALAAP